MEGLFSPGTCFSRPSLQRFFEIGVFRRFKPGRVPDVAQHLTGFDQLAFKKNPAFQSFLTFSGQFAFLFKLLQRLD